MLTKTHNTLYLQLVVFVTFLVIARFKSVPLNNGTFLENSESLFYTFHNLPNPSCLIWENNLIIIPS